MSSFRPLFPLILLLAANPISAQTPEPAATPPCSAPENRQFDFWVGSWTVENPKGEFVGTNEISLILGGCVLQENWKGRAGLTGTSLNIYDPLDRKWHQTWVDSSGSLLVLSGASQEGKMLLEGVQPAADKPGDVVRHRITWTPLSADQVRQFWESSTDGGKTWTVAFDGLYKRKKA
jgi:hypothetical protein